MLKKRQVGLGKGLSALLSDAEEDVMKESFPERSTAGVFEISVDAIETNPFQPRQNFEEEALRELADSIRVHGIIQPITVRKLDNDTYQLISGERRWQAAKIAGLEKIPAFVRTANDQQMLEMALIENIQREDLNPIEIAMSYARLISECNLKHEELGNRVGKKRSTVTNYLGLLKLPPDIQAAIRDEKITMGHAKALVAIENVELQISIFHRILKEELSVRKTEELVRAIFQGNDKAEKKSATEKVESPELKKLQTDLSSHFGTQVKVIASAEGKGEIRIPFHSTEDLNRLIDLIRHQG
ncbi:MAG: ParB/RepB/Spo0J family partition protein [Flammeovirgaceae bacterium]|nr:ParB/RepB/Spo0J family partition protein [Flammeovirgaceae bacterium]MDW8287551.1 ParB/RepB/Spo0J family partition protein [Flammeovirgaceae bacterium]